MNGAVYSMTGFATGTQVLGTSQTITLDIRSVNSRFLDLSFKLPDCYRPVEFKLRERLASQIKRGKCEIKLSCQTVSADADLSLISQTRLDRLLAQQSAIQRLVPNAAALTVAEIMALGASKDEAIHELASQADVLALLERVLESFLQARAIEGSKLVRVMLAQTQALKDLRAEVVVLMPDFIHQQRQRFLQKFNDAVADSGGKISSSSAEERALSEATAFALRVDVTEEVNRLGSHLAEIESVLTRTDEKKEQELGKRLEFLIQELQREANTLGSKSATLQTSKIAIDMKVLIEQLREQVQNIE